MKKVICFSFAALLLAACSKKNNPIANVNEAAKDKDLQGKSFTSECSVKPLDALLTGVMTAGQSSVKSEQLMYRFEGARVIRETRLYNSTDCSGDAALNYAETGTINIDKSKKTNDGGYNMDMSFDKLKVKITSPAGATAANAIQLCGASDWANAQTRDVTAQAKNLTCYSAGVPRHVATVYRVDANNLFLGTPGKGSVDAKDRPASLDMTTKFTAK